MSTSLLDALTTPNIDVDDSAVVPGPNTNVDDQHDIAPHDWQPWTAFNFDNLYELFGPELESQYTGWPEAAPLPKDREINNEETFHDVLRRYIIPPVNYALHDHQRNTDRPFIARGSRCELHNDAPDWSIGMGGPRTKNLLPGDTKLAKKFRPQMATTEPREWRKVMVQIMNYMVIRNCRYGFIITNTYLIALRISRMPIGAGIAAGRPRRQQPSSSHQRFDSDASMASVASAGYAPEDDSTTGELYPPRYQAIPWTNSGPRELTVKLALWCLAKLASEGDERIGTDSPGDDWGSWVQVGHDYHHVMTGVSRTTLPPGRSASSGAGASRSGGPSGQQGSDQRQQQQYQHRHGVSRVNGRPGEDAGLRPGRCQPPGGAYSQATQQLPLRNAPPSLNNTNLKAQGVYRDPAMSEPPPSSERERQVLGVKVSSSLTGKPTFQNAQGKTLKTDRKHWNKVPGGYEYDVESEECIYFTEKLPWIKLSLRGRER